MITIDVDDRQVQAVLDRLSVRPHDMSPATGQKWPQLTDATLPMRGIPI